MTLKTLATIALGSLILVALGCGGSSEKAEPEVVVVVNRAMSYVDAKSGSDLVGKAIFINEQAGVTMMIEVENASPGSHAVHLHEVGDCSADDGTSAGPHWNPTGDPHGKWGHDGFHLGDIGNLEGGADGTGRMEFTSDLWTMGGTAESNIIGKAVVVHASPDDFETQPTGAAGARIGCGVIEG